MSTFTASGGNCTFNFAAADNSGQQSTTFANNLELSTVKDILIHHCGVGNLFLANKEVRDLKLTLGECHGELQFKDHAKKLAWRVENISQPTTACSAPSAVPTTSAAAFAELLPCPCGLPYEDVREACLANKFICPAPRRANRSVQCGELLADHPYRPAFQAPPAGKLLNTIHIYFVDVSVNGIITSLTFVYF